MSTRDDLFAAAKAAREKAHAPYSNFQVGAAILTKSGAIHAGCNIENAAYPEGWCAETTAIGHMVMAGETEIDEVLVVGGGEGLCTPCGGCRQRLAEFGHPSTIVHIAGPDSVRAQFTLGDLLPESFSFAGKQA